MRTALLFLLFCGPLVGATSEAVPEVPPPITPGLLARTLSTLTHALDPVPAGVGVHVELRPGSSPAADVPPAPSTWSWSNYTRPAEDVWPQCSKTPNCLAFSAAPGCEKWKQIAKYPVVVGDMDGSGSRGITWLLRAGGVWMRTTNEWLDWAKDEHPLSNVIMHATHSTDYQVDLGTREGGGATWHIASCHACRRPARGRQWMLRVRAGLPSSPLSHEQHYNPTFPHFPPQLKALPKDVRARAEAQVQGVLKEFANVAQTQLGKWTHRTLKEWEKGLDAAECPRRMGWKHGPTLFLQPVYQHVTGGRHTFVHLIRDGRDMAFSRNRNNLAKYPKFGGQVVGLFKLGKGKDFNKCFFKPDEKHSAERDKECMLMQMRLWERMNLGAAAYSQRELGHRYKMRGYRARITMCSFRDAFSLSGCILIGIRIPPFHLFSSAQVCTGTRGGSDPPRGARARGNHPALF